MTLLIPSPTDFTGYTTEVTFSNVIIFNFEKVFQNNIKLMDLKSEAIEAQRNVKVIILAGKYLTHVIFV